MRLAVYAMVESVSIQETRPYFNGLICIFKQISLLKDGSVEIFRGFAISNVTIVDNCQFKSTMNGL